MKKEIHKIWGVGLTIVLAASLLLSAAPVSGGTLDWGTFSPFPSTTGNVLSANVSVADIAASGDGVMYLCTGNETQIYKSTNDGKTWSKLSENFTTNVMFVAVAPDDSDVVAVGYDFGAVGTGANVSVSINGGSSWGHLGLVTASGSAIADLSAADGMRDLAFSAADGTKNYVAVAGVNTSTYADVWWFDVGAAAPKWNSTRGQDGFEATGTFAAAVAFSPNVASDKVMVAITANTGTTVQYQMFSLSTKKWNSDAAFDSYPVEIKDSGAASITDATLASIALAPDYLGSDDSMRIAFVGLSTTSSTDGGVYRLKDTTDKDITEDKNVFSIAYDGTNLVVGSTSDTKVWRSDNPLATDPDFSTASSLKRPGGNDRITLAWKGTDVVAGARGSGSAFSISVDNGASFNDISIVDTESNNLGTMQDVAISADGSIVYMLCDDGKALSLWRYSSSWERVLAIVGATGSYIVRIAPDDPNAVYVSQRGTSTSTTLYYSQAGGDTKWFTRSSKYEIQDLAVESADVAYVAKQGANTVSKTTNSGFTWDTAKDTGLTGNIMTIRSLGEDKVIVGTASGYVGWSTDGNSSWSKINTGLYVAGNTQVTASGLADGDFIYAATDADASRVERWEIGQSGTSWKNLEAPSANASGYEDCKAYGMALVEGVLYVQTIAPASGTATLRTLSPTSGDPSSGMWSISQEASVNATAAPQSLKVSAGSTKLWFVDTVAPSLYVFEDTLGVAGPTLVSPRDGTTVTMNPVSGKANAVALTWDRPSKAKIYDVKVALDSGFTEIVKSITTASTTDDPVSVVVGPDTDNAIAFSEGTKYYWRVRVNIAGPVRSAWSKTRSFTIGGLPEPVEPVIVQQPPAPVISVPPAPSITIQPPQIVLPPAPAPPPEIVIPPAPAPPAPITPAYIWAIVIIGAILVIALIVLIVRTRRPV